MHLNFVTQRIINKEVLYGLDKKLFQKLNNYIETIKEDYYEKLLHHQTNKLKLIDNHKINFNNENNIENKLNLSISLIIENNKKNREEIEEEEKEEEEKNYNNYTNNIEINYNYSLFQKVWGNIVIRNEILFHLRLYNSHWGKEICLSLKEVFQYKYKNYLDNLQLKERKFEKKKNHQKEPNKDNDDDDEEDDEPLEKFPQSNIRSLYLNEEYDLFYKKMIPPSVTSGISKGMFGDNITSLSFSGPFFNEELSCVWIPKYLKLLKLDIGFQKDIKKGQLPNTLVSLLLHPDYKGVIMLDSIPESVTTLAYNFNSHSNRDSLSCKKIPFSTTTLVLDDDFNQPIRVGDIPQNITNLSFGKSFSSSIGPNSLPKSTRILSLGKFKDSVDHNILQENLISIDFGEYFNRPLFSNMFSFSKSITTIIFGKSFTQQIAPGVFNHLNHLKTLKFGDHFNSRILKNELPESLTLLDLGGYNIPLDIGMFPTSLISLTFHWFNKPIEIGVFPSSIESLNLGWNFNQIIKPGILPKNLKYLDIYNSSFRQDLSIDGILPQSFKNLTISIDNLSLFQSFDSKFSSKYVKLFKTNN
ncbi:hypothetical protein DDB_G0269042 [Dictyostelium discoideum AX4]|uniref:FNIP repeat-containing protein n=1 Tax=Dictyostelium discoideum TaxID=44689 RepID=Q55F40_DICDI|nr:hypothetical protein DDB_G0269042 [Dictyostelium discoideum AX4]EAL73110.1 hypothetical protein DDB_G0269042 [Dictyostelium discoideum AX4]|eukprot:XP_646830.1 hypothetical protein DDB_G0269042 [Dictyostelium discoideum AX4]